MDDAPQEQAGSESIRRRYLRLAAGSVGLVVWFSITKLIPGWNPPATWTGVAVMSVGTALSLVVVDLVTRRGQRSRAGCR